MNRWMMLLVVSLALDVTATTWALYAAPRDGIIACVTNSMIGHPSTSSGE